MNLLNNYIKFIIEHADNGCVSATLQEYNEFKTQNGIEFFEVSDILGDFLEKYIK